jgi:hypothetical protein
VKKALLIGLIVCVLAIGGIGAAFATSMSSIAVGALAVGDADLPEVYIDGVIWGVESNDATVGFVRLSFSRDLIANTELSVKVTDGSGNTLNSPTWFGSPQGPIAAGGYKIFSFTTPIPIADIYDLHVIVAEKTGP